MSEKAAPFAIKMWPPDRQCLVTGGLWWQAVFGDRQSLVTGSLWWQVDLHRHVGPSETTQVFRQDMSWQWSLKIGFTLVQQSSGISCRRWTEFFMMVMNIHCRRQISWHELVYTASFFSIAGAFTKMNYILQVITVHLVEWLRKLDSKTTGLWVWNPVFSRLGHFHPSSQS